MVKKFVGKTICDLCGAAGTTAHRTCLLCAKDLCWHHSVPVRIGDPEVASVCPACVRALYQKLGVNTYHPHCGGAPPVFEVAMETP